MAIKTNERPGTRAVLRHSRMSATKAREVLDLIRGMDYVSAAEALEYTERAAGPVIAKLLHSAAANAEHNEGLDATELYVATCYADEGETLKRWRPRARGRATRIRKRSCHITIILARMPEDKLARRRARVAADLADRRARRVAGTRRRQAQDEATPTAPTTEVEELDTTDAALLEEAPESEVTTSEDAAPEAATEESATAQTQEADAAVEEAEPVTGAEVAAGSDAGESDADDSGEPQSEEGEV